LHSVYLAASASARTAMSGLGQEWPNANRSEADGQEVPKSVPRTMPFPGADAASHRSPPRVRCEWGDATRARDCWRGAEVSWILMRTASIRSSRAGGLALAEISSRFAAGRAPGPPVETLASPTTHLGQPMKLRGRVASGSCDCRSPRLRLPDRRRRSSVLSRLRALIGSSTSSLTLVVLRRRSLVHLPVLTIFVPVLGGMIAAFPRDEFRAMHPTGCW
jgi:hypothetical protein